jgi:phosphonate transport system substrate-binding protein
MRIIKLIWGLMILIIAACGQQNSESYQPEFAQEGIIAKPEYTFAVHPLHNPQQLQAVYGPLVDYLNQHISEAQFRLEASRNYAAYEEKLYALELDFALPNPYQTIIAEDKGYTIFAKMGDDENFRGIFITRKDSQLQTPMDLKGKKVSYPAPTALAATMLPQYFLHQQGLNMQTDIEHLYVGSQESSIMNAYLGEVAAAATWPLPWKIFLVEQPEFAAELELKWQTESLPNNGLVVHPRIEDKLFQQVRDLLLTLHENPAGQEILARMPLSKFEAADSATFQVVRDFITMFSREIRDPTAN